MPAVSMGKLLLYSSGGSLFGADLGKVLKLVSEYNLTPIPRTPDYIKGVILHEGKAIPVFQHSEFEYDEKSEKLVLLIEQKLGPVGLSVDRVVGVVDEEIIEFEEGVAKYGGESITLIESESIVSNFAPDKYEEEGHV